MSSRGHSASSRKGRRDDKDSSTRRRSADRSSRHRSDTTKDDDARRTTIKKYRYADREEDTQDRSLSQATMPSTGQASHVPDQFPGQVPMEYAIPYRPHLPTTDSHGEASSYYGDQGQSVSHQPGVRPGTPLIVGAEPHLLPASAVANPAQDTGNGSAAAFYNVGHTQSNIDHGTSGGIMNSAAKGSNTQYATPPHQPPVPMSARLEAAPQSQHGSSFVVPLAVGAVGLAAAEYTHHQHQSQHDSDNNHSTTTGKYPGSSVSQLQRPRPSRHSPPRRKGTLSRFAEWWNEYDDVRKMEEYTEYIGVCRDCFDPGSQPSDSPRRHRYHRRGHQDYSHRVDKEHRYAGSGSESESTQRRRSALHKHSPRLERRSSDRHSDVSLGVIEMDSRSDLVQGDVQDQKATQSAERRSSHSSKRAPNSRDERKYSYREDKRHYEDTKDSNKRNNSSGFFSNLFSPSSGSTRHDQRYREDDVEIDVENRRLIKRKRASENYRPSTSTATEALEGLGMAAAALAATGRNGSSHPSQHAEMSRRTHSSRRHSQSDRSWESASDSSSSSSLDSALAFGDYHEEEESRTKQNSSVTEYDQSRRYSEDEAEYRAQRHEERRDRQDRRDFSRSQHQYTQEMPQHDAGRPQPLQNLDPRPMSPSPARGEVERRQDVPFYHPQPVSPPKGFAKFEAQFTRLPAEFRQEYRPPLHHIQSAPAEYGVSRQTVGRDVAHPIVDPRVFRADVPVTTRAEISPESARPEVEYAGAGTALAGIAYEVLSNNNKRRERKPSVRFAGIEPEEEEHSTAQQHSRRSSQDDHAKFPEMEDEKVSMIACARDSQVQQNDSAAFPDENRHNYDESILDDDLDDPNFFKKAKTPSQVEPEHYHIRTISADQHRSSTEPILDDDLHDPDYFKKKRRQENKDQNQAVRNMFAEFEDRYTTEHASRSQAEVFRPSELDSEMTALAHRVDAVIGEDGESNDDNGRRRSGSIVPELRVTPATPPPDAVQQKKHESRNYRPSPLSDSVPQETSPQHDRDDYAEGVDFKSHGISGQNRDNAVTDHEASVPKNSTPEKDPASEANYQTPHAESEANYSSVVGTQHTNSTPARDGIIDTKMQDEFDEDVERNTPGGFVDDEAPDTQGVTSSTEKANDPPSQSTTSVDYEEVEDAQQHVADEPNEEDWSMSKVDDETLILATPPPMIPLPSSPVIELPLQHQAISPPPSDNSSASPPEKSNLPKARDDPRRRSANLAFQHYSHAIPELIALPISRPGSPYDDSVQSSIQSPSSSAPLSSFVQPNPPTPSSTAIPLRFLRHVQSPSLSRNSPTTATTVSSPITSPPANVTPIRSKAPRPASGEFKVHHEFRPLYLVERNTKPSQYDEQENFDSLPSLPSSTASSSIGSRTPSISDDRDDSFVSAAQSPAGSFTDEHEPAVEYFEHGGYFDLPEDNRRHDDLEFLDSQQATPKASAVVVGEGERDVPELDIGEDVTVLHHAQEIPNIVDEDSVLSPQEDLPFVTPLESNTLMNTSDDRGEMGETQDPAEVQKNKSSSFFPLGLSAAVATAAAAVSGMALRSHQKSSDPTAAVVETDETFEPEDVDAPAETHAVDVPKLDDSWSQYERPMSKKNKKKAQKQGAQIQRSLIAEKIEPEQPASGVMKTARDAVHDPTSPVLQKAEPVEDFDEQAEDRVLTVVHPALEDDWIEQARPMSKKDKKKAKKLANRAVGVETLEPSLPDDAGSALINEFLIPEDTTEHALTGEPIIPLLGEDQMQKEQIEDLWLGSERPMSKKDKMKAKKCESLKVEAEELNSPLLKDVTGTLLDQPLQYEEAALGTILPELHEPSVIVDSLQQEPAEDVWPEIERPLSKKDKKKAKKMAHRSPMPKDVELPQTEFIAIEAPQIPEASSIEEVDAPLSPDWSMPSKKDKRKSKKSAFTPFNEAIKTDEATSAFPTSDAVPSMPYPSLPTTTEDQSTIIVPAEPPADAEEDQWQGEKLSKKDIKRAKRPAKQADQSEAFLPTSDLATGRNEVVSNRDDVTANEIQPEKTVLAKDNNDETVEQLEPAEVPLPGSEDHELPQELQNEVLPLPSAVNDDLENKVQPKDVPLPHGNDDDIEQTPLPEEVPLPQTNDDELGEELSNHNVPQYDNNDDDPGHNLLTEDAALLSSDEDVSTILPSESEGIHLPIAGANEHLEELQPEEIPLPLSSNEDFTEELQPEEVFPLPTNDDDLLHEVSTENIPLTRDGRECSSEVTQSPDAVALPEADDEEAMLLADAEDMTDQNESATATFQNETPEAQKTESGHTDMTVAKTSYIQSSSSQPPDAETITPSAADQTAHPEANPVLLPLPEVDDEELKELENGAMNVDNSASGNVHATSTDLSATPLTKVNDDDWTFPVKTMKSKKGKKNRTVSESATADNTPNGLATPPLSEPKAQEGVEDANIAREEFPEQDVPPSTKHLAPGPIAPEDDWSGSFKVKTKKDKKGKKGRISYVEEDQGGEKQAPESKVPAMADISVAHIPGSSPNARDAMDPQSPITFKIEDHTGADLTASLQATTEPEPMPSANVESIDTARSNTIEAEPVRDFVVQEESETLEAQPEDDWAYPVKTKKDKKSKKTRAAPTMLEDTETPSTPTEMTTAPETPVEIEDEWATSRKKKKKGKKTKTSLPFYDEFETLPTNVNTPELPPSPTPQIPLTPNDNVEDDWATTSKKGKKGKRNRPPLGAVDIPEPQESSLRHIEEEDPDTLLIKPLTSSPCVNDPEDEGSTTTKKGKKGKKAELRGTPFSWDLEPEVANNDKEVGSLEASENKPDETQKPEDIHSLHSTSKEKAAIPEEVIPEKFTLAGEAEDLDPALVPLPAPISGDIGAGHEALLGEPQDPEPSLLQLPKSPTEELSSMDSKLSEETRDTVPTPTHTDPKTHEQVSTVFDPEPASIPLPEGTIDEDASLLRDNAMASSKNDEHVTNKDHARASSQGGIVRKLVNFLTPAVLLPSHDSSAASDGTEVSDLAPNSVTDPEASSKRDSDDFAAVPKAIDADIDEKKITASADETDAGEGQQCALTHLPPIVDLSDCVESQDTSAVPQTLIGESRDHVDNVENQANVSSTHDANMEHDPTQAETTAVGTPSWNESYVDQWALVADVIATRVDEDGAQVGIQHEHANLREEDAERSRSKEVIEAYVAGRSELEPEEKAPAHLPALTPEDNAESSIREAAGGALQILAQMGTGSKDEGDIDLEDIGHVIKTKKSKKEKTSQLEQLSELPSLSQAVFPVVSTTTNVEKFSNPGNLATAPVTQHDGENEAGKDVAHQAATESTEPNKIIMKQIVKDDDFFTMPASKKKKKKTKPVDREVYWWSVAEPAEKEAEDKAPIIAEEDPPGDSIVVDQVIEVAEKDDVTTTSHLAALDTVVADETRPINLSTHGEVPIVENTVEADDWALQPSSKKKKRDKKGKYQALNVFAEALEQEAPPRDNATTESEGKSDAVVSVAPKPSWADEMDELDAAEKAESGVHDDEGMGENKNENASEGPKVLAVEVPVQFAKENIPDSVRETVIPLPASPAVKKNTLAQTEPEKLEDEWPSFIVKAKKSKKKTAKAPSMMGNVDNTTAGTPTFVSLLATTLVNEGFDPSLAAQKQDTEQSRPRGVHDVLEGDENEASRRASSVNRRRRSRENSLERGAISHEMPAVSEGHNNETAKVPEASFDDIISSSLAAAGFGQRQLNVSETLASNERESEVGVGSSSPTGPSQLWQTSSRPTSPKYAQDYPEEFSFTTTKRKKSKKDKAVADGHDITAPQPVISQPEDPVSGSHRVENIEISAETNTSAPEERQMEQEDVHQKAYQEPISGPSNEQWTFDNVNTVRLPIQSTEALRSPQLDTVFEEEDAPGGIDVKKGIVHPAPETARRIFSSSDVPQDSVIASMRVSTTNAPQPLLITKQRMTSSPPTSEIANTRRQYSRSAISPLPSPGYTQVNYSPTATIASNRSRSVTPSLRRTDRKLSGDLRVLSQQGEGSNVGTTTRSDVDAGQNKRETSDYDPLRGSGNSRMSETSQQHEEWRDTRTSPRAPPSLYRKQSKHILDLESKLAYLTAENESLCRGNGNLGGMSTTQSRDNFLQEKDVEISQIKAKLSVLQQEAARLREHNDQLQVANRNLSADTNGRYGALQAENTELNEQYQRTVSELTSLRQTYDRLNSTLEDTVTNQITSALVDKDLEILSLRAELDRTASQVTSLQRQILASQHNEDYLEHRDEDYFDGACQELCKHIQQWILRFSKFSDNKPCRLTDDVHDERIEGRLDNAMLDGTDVDVYLADRVKRRDVFMSVVMTMIWEYIFTRYLFGLEREQRQRLKALERTLNEVGPARAVAGWRATTLTLLSRLRSFSQQREQDTEAVVQEILNTLSTLLPPPDHLMEQLAESLRRIIRLAVGLSIEMRIQKPEYIMLPPLHPEYDENGNVVRKVHFNASLMNERSGAKHEGTNDAISNDEYEARDSTVRLVLFPLVVKKGDEVGEGEEEIVVCPAQVLVSKAVLDRPRKVVRLASQGFLMEGRSDMSAVSGGGSVDEEGMDMSEMALDR